MTNARDGARVFDYRCRVPARTATPPHGTRRRYVHRSSSCRCAQCRAANARYMARYRAGETTRADTWNPRTWEQLTLPNPPT